MLCSKANDANKNPYTENITVIVRTCDVRRRTWTTRKQTMPYAQ